MTSRLPLVMARAILTVVAGALALVAAEIAVRFLAPKADVVPHWQWDAVPQGTDVRYVTDPELGFRPVLGEGEYSAYGTVLNDYPEEKREGVTRLLFLGDSVTHRWRMQRVFEQRCRDRPIEFWNAGVEGFNTGQEVAYYLGWNHAIEPDHVTLVFHNNDFVATPVVFRDDRGELVVANPRAYLSQRDVALAGASHLYRHYLSWRVSRMLEDDPVTSAGETREALARLASELAEDGIGFDVILFPVLKPPAEWTPYEKRSRQLSLEILQQLEIPYYDLVRPLRKAVRAGLELPESPDDIWHPSDAVARRFARFLVRNDYLEAIAGPGGCLANPDPSEPPNEPRDR